MELVGEYDEALLRFDTLLDSVHGDPSFGHEIEDQNESVVGIGIEAQSLECLGCAP